MIYLPLFRTNHFTSLTKRVFLLSLLFVLIVGGKCAWAVDSPSASPDVLVLVLNGMGAYDQVSINYTGEIPDKQVKADLAEWVRLSGLPVHGGEIASDTNGPGAKPTTSVSFQTTNVVNAANGTLSLDPFVTALRRFKNIQVNFLVASQFQFKGIGNFENDYVDVKLNQSGNSYQYKIKIKNSDFKRAGLPLKIETAGESRRGGMPLGARVLLVLGIAVLGALVAYVATAALTRRRKLSE
ncbi:MAG: hypothetical protein ABFD54_07710 [Armatimonadota bacterium]|nr:hypothetical protein [bacterium]